MNPITSCSAASWTHFTVLQHVLPRAMQYDDRGNLVASPLLLEAPSLENGGLDPGPPFRVRYRIDPHAVWDDGTPITARDFEFTWRAFIRTRHAYGADGYHAIRSVDASNPGVPVITFERRFVDWPSLFGGLWSYLLESAAFPGIDRRSPDLSREMVDEIPFSGGPFKLRSWSQDQATLGRNERYFGKKPYLDQVTFVPLLYQDLQLQALKDGTVSAIYPQPSEVSLLAEFAEEPTITAFGGDGPTFEALWFNHARWPLNDPDVREALSYAVDRQSVVDVVVKPNNPSGEVLNCGFVALPQFGPWCRTRPFARYTYDPARARSILAADGWDCEATFCSKDGRLLTVEYSVIATNTRRAKTQTLVIDHARAAGFALIAKNYGSTGFYSPGLELRLGEFAVGGDADPGVTEMFACDGFPRRKEDLAGRNYIRWCDPEADALMAISDRELDPARRVETMERLYDLEADEAISLPLYVLPAVSAWRSDRIAGPVGLYNSSPYGLFFNMSDWYIAR